MYSIQNNVIETNVISVSNGSTNLSKESPNYQEHNYSYWIFIEGFMFIVIVLGNVLTILAIVWSRKLRSIISNYYILNLAASDLLVGVTLPYHMTFYVDDTWNHNKLICITRFVIINIGCSGSICNLIMIAVDRYIAILYPLRYNVYATQRHALLIIATIWTWTICTSSIPIFWNHFDSSQQCVVETVLPRYYILSVQIPLFLLCLITMFLIYWKILKEANMHRRRMNLSVVSNTIEKNNRKSIQMILLILSSFSISWLPYFILICICVFEIWKTPLIVICYKSAYILAMANSGINPFIYAWKNTNFRRAILKILHFKSPNANSNSSFKIYLEKQHELERQQIKVRKNCHINETNNSHSSDRQSNHTEENKIDDTTL